MNLDPRDPTAEARAALGDPDLTPLVLEPSPPANLDPEFFADDPTVADPNASGIVSPIGTGEGTWSALVGIRPDLSQFAADRWLGDFKRLELLPARYNETRGALHQIAFFAIAPKRHSVNGKIGLRFTHHGFGTPFFGENEQVRVQDATLIYQRGREVETTPISTVAAACDALGIPYVVDWFPGLHDPLTPVGSDAALEIEPRAVRALADWFGFATSVLEQMRRVDGAVDPSRVQIWCEHFDPAFEMGSADAGRRASFGASPGDQHIDEPYLYVAPWAGVGDDPYWNASTFTGAVLDYQTLIAADDQRQTALDFFRKGWEKLSS